MKRIFGIMFLTGLLIPSLVMSQPARGRARRQEMMRQGAIQPNKDTRDMIEDLRIVRLTKELNLTDQQLAKFLPKMREMEAARREFHQKQVGLIKDMDDLLGRGASEKDLQTKLSEFEKQENDFQSKERESRKALTNQLSVEQQARYVVFQEKFEREMRELIRGIRQGGLQPGMGSPPSPGP